MAYDEGGTIQELPEELQRIVSTAIEDAANFIDEELSPQRAIAAEYYAGKKFGNEQEGRSQLVLTEVRDGVQAVLPSLMRVFFGPDRVVEFRPTKPGQGEQARATNAVVEDVFVRRNHGYRETLSVLKDGLTKRIGIFKWGVTRTEEAREETIEMPMDEAAALNGQEGVTFGEAVFETGMIPVTLRETVVTKEPWVKAVPPDQFIWSREATCLEDALFVGHRVEKRRSELLEMGIPASVLDEHGGTDRTLSDNPEEIARRELQNVPDQVDPEAGEGNEKVLYVEGYMLLPKDPDDAKSPTELRRICTIGTRYHVVVNEPATQRRFAIFTPDPEPHAMTGFSWADRLMDMQLYKSNLIRGVNDSMSLSLFPRLGYVENMVNADDVMNTEMGAAIRMRQPGMIQEISHTFVGKEGLGLLAYADDIIERRTGRNKGTAGLEADSLQSSTREGVQAVLSTSQEQIELLARIFAELTLKPMLEGLLKMLIEEDVGTQIVEINGEYVEVPVGQLGTDLEVAINVALGTSFTESRVADLMMIAQKQEQILTQFGPQNPMVTLKQFRDTLAKAIRMRGHDPNEFFNPVPADWQPPEPPPPPPTPEQIIAQAELEREKMRTEKELEIKEAELALKREESMARMELEREKLAVEAKLRMHQVATQAETQLEMEKLRIAAKLTEISERTEIDGVRVAAEHGRNRGTQGVSEARLELEAQRVGLEAEKVDLEEARVELEAQKLAYERRRAAESTE